MKHHKIYKHLTQLLQDKILILDGAMGTMIQNQDLSETQFRGNKYQNVDIDQKGNNELLNITQPDIIKNIHKGYLEAGADIIETNTFNANSISLQDFGMESIVSLTNKEAAKIAQECKEEYNTSEKPRFVAGVIGPTNKTVSISPRVEDPGYREVSFDQFAASYKEQIEALIEGSVDLLLIETIFDSLNAKAALYAIDEIINETGNYIPVMVSFTINDSGGRMLTGQNIEAFLTTVANLPVFSIGMNCAFGAEKLKPHLKKLSQIAPFYVNSHPNAGLPNELGEYDQTPRQMGIEIESYCKEDLVNIIGGCCGSRPEHIAEIRKAADKYPPRNIPPKRKETKLSGLQALNIDQTYPYAKIGERTNVMGSRKFLRLIREENYEEALDVAKHQVDAGAEMLNINMDEAMLDGKAAMERFLRLLAAEPKLAGCPLMLDSSDFDILETGLKNVTGKPIINSISLKGGEEDFLAKAETIKKHGAATVVMAFDEKGQADTYERKIEICKRSYDLLTEKINFPAEDIVFDPNVLTIGTGIEAHNNYAVDFIKATRWIKENLPYAKVSGGISNVSFSFRGNTEIRDSMNSVFIHQAVEAGLDMAIINPAKTKQYDQIPEELRNAVEDVLLNKAEDATEKLLELGQKYKGNKAGKQKTEEDRTKTPPKDRVIQALIEGDTRHLNEDLEQLRHSYDQTLDVIEGPLMKGMSIVGDYFEKGDMFLPQVVKTARTMKQAVSYLMPYIEEENKSEANKPSGKILLATVKGDVHDIGKNILSLVLNCNNYELIDLGVMIDNETIIQAIDEHKPDIVGVSGLITPSLHYMAELAQKMEEKGVNVPLILGGATTSNKHTAVKVAPHYSGLVLYGADASKSAQLINKLMNKRKELEEEVKTEQATIRERYYKTQNSEKVKHLSLNEARKKPASIDFTGYKPKQPNILGTKVIKNYDLKSLEPFIDWKMFFHALGMKGKYPNILNLQNNKGSEARKLFEEASQMLQDIIQHQKVEARASIGLYPAAAHNDNILIYTDDNRNEIKETLPMLRQQGNPNKEYYLSLSDYIAPKDSEIKDYLGTFAISAGFGAEKHIKEYDKQRNNYKSIMFRLLCDRLTEALSEKLHYEVRTQYWGYAKDENSQIKDMLANNFKGIRPAPGYPTCPDHRIKAKIFKLMNVEENIGIQLTESYAMQPVSSVCGCYIACPHSKYFNLGKIARDQVEDYAQRENISFATAESLFSPNLNYDSSSK